MSQNNQEQKLTVGDNPLIFGAKSRGTRVAMLLEQMRGQGHAYKRGNVWWISYYGPGVDKKTGKPCRKEYRESTHVTVGDTAGTPKGVVNLLKKKAARALTNQSIDADKLTFMSTYGGARAHMMRSVDSSGR